MKSKLTVNGMPALLFLFVFLAVMVGAYMGIIPDNMGGALGG